jgi:hypothetical protein
LVFLSLTPNIQGDGWYKKMYYSIWTRTIQNAHWYILIYIF